MSPGSFGGMAMGTIGMASQASTLEPYPVNIVGGKEHVTALSQRYAFVGALVRKGIEQTASWDDADTADMLTDLSLTMDKSLWFLETHLQADN